MNMANKQGVFEEKLGAYLRGPKKRRSEILDAVVEVSGLTRKGAIKRFRAMQMRDPCALERRGRPRTYTPDCLVALKEVWEIGSEACGENLHPMIGEYVGIQMREDKWAYGTETTEKLLHMSCGSVKAYVGAFTRTRRNFGGRRTTQKSSVISMVPVRMDGWDAAKTVAALNDLYDVLTPYLNHFIASRRIVSKERIGARWKVAREKIAKTPYRRVLERSDVSDEVKANLRVKHVKLNPATMKKEIDLLIKRVHDIQRRYGDPKKLSKAA